MSRATWKATERAIAARLGGRRVPITGRARGDAPDVEHPTLSIEVKHRASLPEWLVDAMRQARAAAKPGQTPVVILHELKQRHDDDFCMVRLADLANLLDQSSRNA